MSVAYHTDDFREHGIACGLGGPDRQCAVAVDRSGIHFIASFLCHKSTFPGNRSLINIAATLGHLSVERDTVSAAHHEAVTDRNLSRRNIGLRSVVTNDARRGWC